MGLGLRPNPISTPCAFPLPLTLTLTPSPYPFPLPPSPYPFKTRLRGKGKGEGVEMGLGLNMYKETWLCQEAVDFIVSSSTHLIPLEHRIIHNSSFHSTQTRTNLTDTNRNCMTDYFCSWLRFLPAFWTNLLLSNTDSIIEFKYSFCKKNGLTFCPMCYSIPFHYFWQMSGISPVWKKSFAVASQKTAIISH